REVADLPRLDQRERFKQFVKGTEATGKDDERSAVLHKHHLADEEVFERETESLVSVWFLLERQLDVAADRKPTCVERAAICGFHNSWTTTSDHCKTLCGEKSAGFLRGLVIRIVGFGTCGAEDRDA